MLLLTHIYNLPFTEVCMFIGSLEKSDKDSDWWWATLQTPGAQTSLPCRCRLSAKPEQSAPHPSAVHFLRSPSATWQRARKECKVTLSCAALRLHYLLYTLLPECIRKDSF